MLCPLSRVKLHATSVVLPSTLAGGVSGGNSCCSVLSRPTVPLRRSFASQGPWLYGPPGTHHQPVITSTTVLCIRKDNEVVMIGDGQVSAGSTIVKMNANKIRRLGADKDVLAGFAGAAADALALFERLENKLEHHKGQLLRASVEMAKQWRTDKYLRTLQASMLVADSKISLELTGDGNIMELESGYMAIGSGSAYALAAARALRDHAGHLSAEELARHSMKIAAEMCIYTNSNFTMEKLLIDEAYASKQPNH